MRKRERREIRERKRNKGKEEK